MGSPTKFSHTEASKVNNLFFEFYSSVLRIGCKNIGIWRVFLSFLIKIKVPVDNSKKIIFIYIFNL